jgi:hypothetical protein
LPKAVHLKEARNAVGLEQKPVLMLMKDDERWVDDDEI